MNDDHMDGFTAFPYLKVHVKPRKGSALFWFTLKHSGQKEYGTRFTQCPVTYRSKWLASKALFEQGQDSRKPCLPTKHFIEAKIEDFDDKFF